MVHPVSDVDRYADMRSARPVHRTARVPPARPLDADSMVEAQLACRGGQIVLDAYGPTAGLLRIADVESPLIA